jgi:transcriptional regulator with XRE-family HTH domain
VESLSFLQTIAEPYDLGAVIKYLRSRKEMSSRALAAEIGASSSYVSKIESGQVPSADKFVRIMDALDCSSLEVQFLLELLRK